MGQVLSYIWKCIRPKLRNETKTTSQDVQFNHLINPFQQQNHYITIPASDIDNVSSSIPENVTSTVTDDNDLSTRVPFQQPNHYITIPASDTDNVSSSIPENVTSTVTDDNDLSTRVPFQQPNHYITIPASDTDNVSSSIPENVTSTVTDDNDLSTRVPFQQPNHYITIPASDTDNVSSSIPENVTSTVTDDNDLSTRVPFQQPNHYITIPASDTDNVSSLTPEDVTSTVTNDNDLSTRVPFMQQNHYINIPTSDTDNVSSSIPENVTTSTINDDNDLSTQVPCHKLDLRDGEVIVYHANPVMTPITKEIIADSVSNESKDTSIKKIGQYASNQKILLVGEGDFSFSACLAKAFGSAANIFATSLNSHDFLIENYGKFLSNKKELERRGSTVIHGVNARTMAKHPLLGTLKFDRIIFNFPHAGKFGQTDADLRCHKELLRQFFSNAKKMIKDDGEIHITHKSNGFYLEWDIPQIGLDRGLRLIQEIKFKRSKFPGYNTKYGFGGDKDFECNPCKTYKFGLNLM